MRLRDMFYLRFGLFMERQYGRAVAYIVEFLLVSFVVMVVLFILVGSIRALWAVYEYTQDAERKVAVAEKEAADYQNALLTCLNGGLIGHTAEGEYVGCEGATTFRMKH